MGRRGSWSRGSVPDFPQWGWRLIVARISPGSGGRAARSYWLIRPRAEGALTSAGHGRHAQFNGRRGAVRVRPSFKHHRGPGKAPLVWQSESRVYLQSVVIRVTRGDRGTWVPDGGDGGFGGGGRPLVRPASVTPPGARPLQTEPSPGGTSGSKPLLSGRLSWLLFSHEPWYASYCQI